MKKIYLAPLLAVLLIIGVAKSADNNATLSLVKDKGTDLFILNMRDSQGIRSFSLVFPTDKLPYSGELSGCSASRKIDNIAINDPSDFKPLMNAVILDCQGNETEFEISAPVSGVAQVKKTGVEPTPPPPASQTATQPLSGTSAGAEQDAASSYDPLADIQYPIKELGNCGSRAACKTYCEKTENIEQCIAFAEEHNLISGKEIQKGKKFSQILKTGTTPGGCKTEKSCFEYCNNVDAIDECVAFAEKNGFMEERELNEAKKIKEIIKSGKSLPGNCKNRAACEAYCKNTEHMDECIAFAKEAGFMTEKEIAEAEKFLPLMKSGQTPGGCKSKEECEAFCEDENNFEKCFEFADKAGLITNQEREIMKKTGGKGPGGCRGRACQTFCDNIANQKTCFEFGKEHGFISEQDIQRMDDGKRMLKEQLENGSPEIQECLKSVIDINVLESDGFAGGQELGEKMRACFEKLMPEGMHEQFEFRDNGEFSGPGGCKSREECESYCRTNPEVCGIKMPEMGGQGMPPFEGNDQIPPERAGGGGFSGQCSFMDFNPVCAKYGDDPSHTFNNECFARQHNATNIKQGGCPEDAPCERTPSPVCGSKNGIIQNYYNKCVAEGDGAEIKYEGACRNDAAPPTSGDYQQQYQQQYEQQYQQQFEGPGGCKTAEECRAYCTQNYQDPACQQFMPSSSVPIQSSLALLLWPFLELLK